MAVPYWCSDRKKLTLLPRMPAIPQPALCRISTPFPAEKRIRPPKGSAAGAVNFAFIGQFAETPRDTIFTTEYSMRTGMESVYTLLDIDRGVPEVWGSKYDVREILRACYYAIDKKAVIGGGIALCGKRAAELAIKKSKGNRFGAFC